MVDVVVVGAGPAGTIAGIVLARAGVTVRLVDRARFPRDKLCGDTVNPGTLERLRRLGVDGDLDARALRVDGMRVTGERGDVIDGRYPRGQSGRAIVRRDLDWMLLQQAIAAGCEYEPAVAVRRATVDESRGMRRVIGVAAGGDGHERVLPARVIVAADGRHSTIAFGLGLARHPARPRRWAVGGYFENVSRPTINAEPEEHAENVDQNPLRAQRAPRCTSCFGEMHVRGNGYIGVAPVPGGLTNVCLVRPSGAGDTALADPAGLLTRALAADSQLRDRFADARLVAPPVVLGPLAVESPRTTIDGLLFAGDAAGFIDPMTGDGLRFAVQGGELAAAAALQALEHGWTGVHARLAGDRRRAFASKWRFNRALRALVSSARAIDTAAVATRLAPGILRAVIARAGDCGTTIYHEATKIDEGREE
jgi:menaquinone-9 beta-reductase